MADPGPPPSSDATAMTTRPFVVLVASHWLSQLGVGLALTALLCWLFMLPVQMRGHAENPYIGILAFVILPLVLFLGLGLMPIGVFLARRRVRKHFETEVMDRSAAFKRLAVVLAVTTAVNAVVGTQLTYRAVEHMETAQFCGSCHVMTPDFRSHQNVAHARITRRLDEELRVEHDLSLGEYDALLALAEATDRRLRMNSLADRVVLSKSGVTRLIDRLVADGLVVRDQCLTDARGAEAVLTEKGLERLRRASRTHLRGIERHFFDVVDEADLGAIRRAMVTVAEHAESANRPLAEPAQAG